MIPAVLLELTEATGSLARLLAIVLACLGAGAAHADGSAAKSAAALGTKYGSLHDLLGHNQFQRPLYMESSEASGAGPLGTRDYRVMLEAVPVDGGRTFIHFTYSYAYGLAGRLAMQAYLGTVGSGKVGFTVVGVQADGRPLHIGGMRGLAERNTMRYYLAIEAFLGALSAPPQARREKSMRDWFSSVERYPRQLHELERSEYLHMKRREYLRQQAAPRATRR